MRKQRIISILLTLCMVFALLPNTALAASADQFTDVSKDSWYYEEVSWVVDKGYFKGTSDTTFAPDTAMTRAMFVTVLARYAGAKLDSTQSAFTDVPTGEWYTGAVNWAAKNKIVEGRGKGIFDPNTAVTREEMCTILDRYLEAAGEKAKLTKNPAKITDLDTVSSYAIESVENCVDYGVILGYPDGTFGPKLTATRAHVAALLHRLQLKVSGGGGTGSNNNNNDPDPDDLTAVAMAAAAEIVDGYLTAAEGVVNDATGRDVSGNASVTYDDATKAVTAAFTGNLRSDMVVDVVGMAVEVATILVKDVVKDADGTKEELTTTQIYNILVSVLDAIDGELGTDLLNDALSVETKAELKALAEDIYNKVYTYGKDKAKNVWAEFKNDNGAYPFDSISVKAAGQELFSIDVTNGTDLKLPEGVSSKAAAVKAAAIAVAKEMYADLKTNTTETSTIVLNGTLTLEFDLKDAHKDCCTDKFTVTCEATLSSDMLAYSYDAENDVHNVTVIITEELQEAYDYYVDEAVQAITSTEEFKNAVLGGVENALKGSFNIDGIDVSAILANWLTTANIQAVLNGDATDNTALYTGIKTAIDGMIGTEVQGYDLGALISDKTGSMVNLETEDVNALLNDEYVFAAGTPAERVMTLAEYETILSNLGINIDFKATLEDAAKAEMNKLPADLKQQIAEAGLEDYAVYAALGAMGLDYYADKAADEFAAQTTQAQYTDFIDDKVADAVASSSVQQAIDPMKQYAGLLTFDDMKVTMADKTVAGAVALLDNARIIKALDGKAASYMDLIAKAVAKLPKSGKVTVEGTEIVKSDLNGIANAADAAELYEELLDLASTKLGTLKVSDLAEGITVSVETANHGPYTVNVSIDVE